MHFFYRLATYLPSLWEERGHLTVLQCTCSRLRERHHLCSGIYHICLNQWCFRCCVACAVDSICQARGNPARSRSAVRLLQPKITIVNRWRHSYALIRVEHARSGIKASIVCFRCRVVWRKVYPTDYSSAATRTIL